MTTQGSVLNKANIINRFITVVYNPHNSMAKTWHAGNPPFNSYSGPGTDYKDPTQNRILGSTAEVAPTLPADQGVAVTYNVFYLLHNFAVQLTRFRQAEMRRYETNVPGTITAMTSLGFAMTAYRDDNTINFPLPNIPDVATIITASAIETYIQALRTQLVSISSNTSNATVFNYVSICHTSCHGSCHGSRGRR